VSATYYRRPAFREGVRTTVADDNAVFDYAGIRFDAEFEPAVRDSIATLCEDLSRGLDGESLRSRYGAFAPCAEALLRSFDRYGYLCEAALDDPMSIEGRLFADQVAAFAERERRRVGSTFYESLINGRATRAALISYVQEYYHVVRASPAIIGASLAHAGSATRGAILESFLRAEIGHDRILKRALLAAGVEERSIEEALPMPETFGVISMLHVLASQEPLAFFSCLFLFEEESRAFHDAFAERARQVALPEEFLAPVLEHAHINDDGNHGTITSELLSCIGAVSPEERIVVLKHVSIAVESLSAIERAILDWRG